MDVYDQQAMMQQQQYQQYQATAVVNQGYNSATALQIRLDTERVIADFQKYLSGRDLQWVQNANGESELVDTFKGKQIINQRGMQAILKWLSVVNTHTIQGNFVEEEDYQFYLRDYHLDVVEDLLTRRVDYGIDMKDFGGVVHIIVDYARLVLTRPLFDKERQGMNQSQKTVETIQPMPQKSGFLGGFFGGRK